MRKIVIAGNWKMHKTRSEALELVETIKKGFKDNGEVKVIVAPPFTSLLTVSEALKDSTIEIAAQNMFFEKEGAYTGEISPLMLKDVGVHYVIIGHSERRKYFCETDENVNKKIKVALDYSITPILCIGESLEERKEGKTFEKVEKQIDLAFKDISPENAKKIIIAYEPIWAIGTGETATPEQAEEVHLFIRKKIAKIYGNNIASYAIILYGGSVKPNNAFSLMRENDIDGVLVGGASLKGDSFIEIIKAGIRVSGGES